VHDQADDVQLIAHFVVPGAGCKSAG
jgi:hypothetical protein